jgi:hypothetical protein
MWWELGFDYVNHRVFFIFLFFSSQVGSGSRSTSWYGPIRPSYFLVAAQQVFVHFLIFPGLTWFAQYFFQKGLKRCCFDKKINGLRAEFWSGQPSFFILDHSYKIWLGVDPEQDLDYESKRSTYVNLVYPIIFLNKLKQYRLKFFKNN